MTLPEVYFLKLKNFSILQQLKIEEALLRADSKNWCIFNEGTPPAIVLGLPSNLKELIDITYYRKNPIQVIRRFSGGGTVSVNKNTLFFTFICNSQDIQVSSIPEAVFAWTAEFYKAVFSNIHFILKENDYTIEGKKFGGNAQYMRQQRWLHHSSILWDFSLHQMNYLCLPKVKPAYRQERSHCDFLCKLVDFFPNTEYVKNQFISRLSAYFTIIEVDVASLDDILRRIHRKSTQILQIV